MPAGHGSWKFKPGPPPMVDPDVLIDVLRDARAQGGPGDVEVHVRCRARDAKKAARLVKFLLK